MQTNNINRYLSILQIIAIFQHVKGMFKLHDVNDDCLGNSNRFTEHKLLEMTIHQFHLAHYSRGQFILFTFENLQNTLVLLVHQGFTIEMNDLKLQFLISISAFIKQTTVQF